MAGYANIETKILDNGFVVAVITKTADLPNEENDNYNSNYLRSIIMEASKKFSFKVKYQWFNFIQFFVQSLFWENRQRLKRLLNK